MRLEFKFYNYLLANKMTGKIQLSQINLSHMHGLAQRLLVKGRVLELLLVRDCENVNLIGDSEAINRLVTP